MATRDERISAIADGLGHPLRRWLLRRFAEAGKDGVSPSELSKQAPKRLKGDRLTNTSYHVRELALKGLIELAVTKQRPNGSVPRRGALEHYYRTNALGAKALDVLDFLEGTVK